MATVKISILPEQASPLNSDILPIVSGGVTCRATIASIVNVADPKAHMHAVSDITEFGSGTTTIDFGSFPGKSDTTKDVTGLTSIGSGAVIQAWLTPTASSDHTADEHLLETISVVAGNVVAETGFTIYARNNSQLNEPVTSTTRDSRGGIGTRIYGVWNVTYIWRN